MDTVLMTDTDVTLSRRLHGSCVKTFGRSNGRVSKHVWERFDATLVRRLKFLS